MKENIRKLRVKRSLLDSETKIISSKRNDVLKKQSQVSAQRHEVDTKIEKLITKRNHAKLLVGKLVSEITDADEKILSNTTKQSGYSTNITHLQKQHIKLERASDNHKQSIDEINHRLRKFTLKKQTLEKDINGLTELINASSKGADKYETKIKFAKGIMHEDYSISKLKHSSENLGIKGLVYEILKWDKKYERSIMAVCADWIKAVVVKDFTTLVSLAEFVQEQKLPKLKIIPL